MQYLSLVANNNSCVVTLRQLNKPVCSHSEHTALVLDALSCDMKRDQAIPNPAMCSRTDRLPPTHSDLFFLGNGREYAQMAIHMTENSVLVETTDTVGFVFKKYF